MGTPETSTELRTGQLALWGASYHKQTRGNEETVRANLAIPIRSLSADGKAMPPPTTAKTWDSGCSLSHRKSVSFLLQCVQPVFSPVCSSCSHLSHCPAPPTHWLLFTTALLLVSSCARCLLIISSLHSCCPMTGSARPPVLAGSEGSLERGSTSSWLLEIRG